MMGVWAISSALVGVNTQILDWKAGFVIPSRMGTCRLLAIYPHRSYKFHICCDLDRLQSQHWTVYFHKYLQAFTKVHFEKCTEFKNVQSWEYPGSVVTSHVCPSLTKSKQRNSWSSVAAQAPTSNVNGSVPTRFSSQFTTLAICLWSPFLLPKT